VNVPKASVSSFSTAASPRGRRVPSILHTRYGRQESSAPCCHFAM